MSEQNASSLVVVHQNLASILEDHLKEVFVVVFVLSAIVSSPNVLCADEFPSGAGVFLAVRVDVTLLDPAVVAVLSVTLFVVAFVCVLVVAGLFAIGVVI